MCVNSSTIWSPQSNALYFFLLFYGLLEMISKCPKMCVHIGSGEWAPSTFSLSRGLISQDDNGVKPLHTHACFHFSLNGPLPQECGLVYRLFLTLLLELLHHHFLLVDSVWWSMVINSNVTPPILNLSRGVNCPENTCAHGLRNISPWESFTGAKWVKLKLTEMATAVREIWTLLTCCAACLSAPWRNLAQKRNLTN